MSDYKMTPAEFADLRVLVADIGQSDVKLGHVLETIVLHVGHFYGLDPAEEDARLKALADDKAKLDEQGQQPVSPDVSNTPFSSTGKLGRSSTNA